MLLIFLKFFYENLIIVKDVNFREIYIYTHISVVHHIYYTKHNQTFSIIVQVDRLTSLTPVGCFSTVHIIITLDLLTSHYFNMTIINYFCYLSEGTYT